MSNTSDQQEQLIVNLILKDKYLEIFKHVQKEFQINVNTQVIKKIMLDYYQFTHSEDETGIENEIEIVRNYYGIRNQQDLFRFLVKQRARQIKEEEMGESLKDPKVQAMLSQKQRDVAKTLLIASSETENYGGVTIDTLASRTELQPQEIEQILDYFMNNYWVISSGEDLYLPRV